MAGFSVLGVAIGTAAVIIALSIINGFEKEIKEKVFSFTSHVQIVGFQNRPLPYEAESIQRVREQVDGVRSISPFVAKEAMVRAGDNVDGIMLRGAGTDYLEGTIRRYLVEGRALSHDASAQEIVIGKKLSNRLGVHLGDRVTVFGLPGGGRVVGQPRAMVFEVAGIFESGMSEYDDIYAFTSLLNAQKLFQLGNAVHGYDVVTNDVAKAEDIGAEIQQLLGYPHYARTAAQLYRNLFAWIELQKKPAPIFLGLIIAVAAVNIIGALLMLVLEKARGIGILKSIGARPSDIQAVFLLQGTLIGVVGIIAGNLLAYGVCWFQATFKPLSIPADIYFMNTVPILMRFENFIVVSAIVLALCVLAALIPSRSAARLDPITTLRFT